ncbi:hypothetical protein K440DRAFT_678231 [Wilcoxina mikolae CBS 423.85]|nr:hypothetical protein K440DRAFT_678231 [Wilcoxina mikolae CBS 423.85]
MLSSSSNTIVFARRDSQSGDLTTNVNSFGDVGRRCFVNDCNASVTTDVRCPPTKPSDLNSRDWGTQTTRCSPIGLTAPDESNTSFPDALSEDKEADRFLATGDPRNANSFKADAPFQVTCDPLGDAVFLRCQPGDVTDLIEHQSTPQMFCGYTGVPRHGTNWLHGYLESLPASSIVHNPLFDDPNIREKFPANFPGETPAPLTTGWFWDKRSGTIVEKHAELRPDIAKFLSHIELARL